MIFFSRKKSQWYTHEIGALLPVYEGKIFRNRRFMWLVEGEKLVNMVFILTSWAGSLFGFTVRIAFQNSFKSFESGNVQWINNHSLKKEKCIAGPQGWLHRENSSDCQSPPLSFPLAKNYVSHGFPFLFFDTHSHSTSTPQCAMYNPCISCMTKPFFFFSPTKLVSRQTAGWRPIQSVA